MAPHIFVRNSGCIIVLPDLVSLPVVIILEALYRLIYVAAGCHGCISNFPILVFQEIWQCSQSVITMAQEVT